MDDTIVLGAGLQGVCTALALAAMGRRVTVIEREFECLTRASLRNEGKIHLGFVYANDPTGRTAALMLDAAMAFAPLLDRWLEVPIPWNRLRAEPFTYLILRDSQVPTRTIEAAWTAIERAYVSKYAGAGVSYLGTYPADLRAAARSSAALWPDAVDSVVPTAELALDMPGFCTFMRGALAGHPRIRFLFQRDVTTVRRMRGGFEVSGTTPDGQLWSAASDTVVNCLWEGRLPVDRQLDLLPTRPWVYRLKYRVLGRLPNHLARLPSLTMVLGKYGDIVNYGDGRVYFSWYPACLRGWSGEVTVPPAWDRACRGGISPEEQAAIARESLEAFDVIVPGFAQCRIDSVAAGVIFSWGRTDIDDPVSELHRRDDIGPSAHDGYVTVNTGKITTAPLFGQRVADLLQ